MMSSQRELSRSFRKFSILHSNSTWRSSTMMSSLIKGTGKEGKDRVPFKHVSVLNVHTHANDDSDQKVVEPKAKEGNISKMKSYWRAYGWVFVGTYFGVYFSFLGGIYAALDNDLFLASSMGVDPANAVKMAVNLVEKISMDRIHLSDYVNENPKAGTFAVGWAITKVLEPLRFLISASLTPSVAKAFGKTKVKIS